MNRYTSFVSCVNILNTSEKNTLELTYGQYADPKTGKDKPLTATVNVPGQGITSAALALDRLAKLPLVNVKWSQDKLSAGATLRLKRKPIMNGDACAVIFAHFGGLDFPLSISTERVNAILEQTGLAQEQDADEASADSVNADSATATA